MVIGLLDVGMQAVYSIEVKYSPAAFLVYIHNGTLCQRFEDVVTAEAVREYHSNFCYVPAENIFQLVAGWFGTVYGCRDGPAVTLDSCTDRNIFI
jgi:hypothetical protein